jgi:two-component system, LuxR family, response regulator FixJ
VTNSSVIHVVDDDEAMRESLVALLGDAGYEVRAYASADDLMASGAPEVGCIVSDIRMPGMDGLTLLKKLRTDGSVLPLILITGHGDVPLAVAAMKAGAVDFLEKPFEAEELLAAIETGLRCGGDPASDAAVARHRLDTLTGREREVLEQLVAGESNKEAALRLGVSHRTVEFHRAHIMEKTGAKGLADLVRLWLAGTHVHTTGTPSS